MKSGKAALVLFVLALVVGSYSLGKNTQTDATKVAATFAPVSSEYYAVHAPTDAPLVKPTDNPIARQQISTDQPTTKLTPKATAEATAKVAMKTTAKPTAKPTTNPTKAPKKSRTVYVSRTGTKYHFKSTCSNMKSPSTMTLDEAVEMGRGPCSKCAK